jgi:PAS domain S-box-containing protein
MTDAPDGLQEPTVAHYRQLVEDLHDVVTVVDRTGVVRYQSPSSERVKGWPPGALVGENVLEHVHPEDRDRIASALSAVVDEPGRLDSEVEFRFRTPDGEWRWLASTATNPGPDSPIDGYVVTSRDVTERKRLEAERRRQRERLERFGTVLSHDLRGPLSVLSGSLDLAERTGDAEHFRRCRDAVDRMETLVDDLLALARQGESVGELEPVDLAAVARRAWESVETDDASLDVETTATVRADPSRLQQLLENLFRNAVEHGPAGGGSTADEATRDGSGLAVTVADLPGAECGFSVADDGRGIPDGKREAVFEAGYTTADHGTGLGLVIVQDVADAHGWTVEATENEGGGTRIEVAGVEPAA